MHNLGVPSTSWSFRRRSDLYSWDPSSKGLGGHLTESDAGRGPLTVGLQRYPSGASSLSRKCGRRGSEVDAGKEAATRAHGLRRTANYDTAPVLRVLRGARDDNVSLPPAAAFVSMAVEDVPSESGFLGEGQRADSYANRTTVDGHGIRVWGAAVERHGAFFSLYGQGRRVFVEDAVLAPSGGRQPRETDAPGLQSSLNPEP